MPPAPGGGGAPARQGHGDEDDLRSWHRDHVTAERPRTAKERGIAMRRVPRPQSAPGGAWATLGSTRCVPGTLRAQTVEFNLAATTLLHTPPALCTIKLVAWQVYPANE